MNRICCVGRCRREYAWQACRSYVGHSYLQCPREVDPLPTMLLVRFTPKWSSDWVRGKPEKPLRHLSSFFSLTIKQLNIIKSHHQTQTLQWGCQTVGGVIDNERTKSDTSAHTHQSIGYISTSTQCKEQRKGLKGRLLLLDFLPLCPRINGWWFSCKRPSLNLIPFCIFFRFRALSPFQMWPPLRTNNPSKRKRKIDPAGDFWLHSNLKCDD